MKQLPTSSAGATAATTKPKTRSSIQKILNPLLSSRIRSSVLRATTAVINCSTSTRISRTITTAILQTTTYITSTRTTTRRILLVIIAIVLALLATYLHPTIQPHTYNGGDRIPIYVNSLTSIRTQIPKEYYRLPVCHPGDGPNDEPQQKTTTKKMSDDNKNKNNNNNNNNSKITTANHTDDYHPPYPLLPHSILTLKDEYCKIVCQPPPLTDYQSNSLKTHIRNGYHTNWILDDLPSASVGITQVGGTIHTHYAGGFPLGFVEEMVRSEKKMEGDDNNNDDDNDKKNDDNSIFIYNHVTITLEYHQPDITKSQIQILKFTVEPLSISHSFIGGYVWDGKDKAISKQLFSTCSTGGTHLSRKDIQDNEQVKVGANILYTYDVVWKDAGDGIGGGGGLKGRRKGLGEGVVWGSRWEAYVNGGGGSGSGEKHVLWYSISNCLGVMIFLTVGVLGIGLRGLRREIESFQQHHRHHYLADCAEQEVPPLDSIDMVIIEEPTMRTALSSSSAAGRTATAMTGWQRIHTDVFRPPETYPTLYCAFVGSGFQLTVTFALYLLFMALRVPLVDYPSHRFQWGGCFLVPILGIYTFCGTIGGYVSGAMYRTISSSSSSSSSSSANGRNTVLGRCAIQTVIIFPTACLTVFLLCNMVLYSVGSSDVASLPNILFLVILWTFVSTPLVFFGASTGYHYHHPINKHHLAKSISTSPTHHTIPPPTTLVTRPSISILAAGIVPFSAAYIELFFIMTCLWMDQYYYTLASSSLVPLVVFGVILIICAEISVLLVYYQLCVENWRWWWFSFLCGGSMGGYVIGYSVVWFQALGVAGISAEDGIGWWCVMSTYVLYFGCMSLISFGLFLITGSVGSLVSFWFMRKIYSIVKED